MVRLVETDKSKLGLYIWKQSHNIAWEQATKVQKKVKKAHQTLKLGRVIINYTNEHEK